MSAISVTSVNVPTAASMSAQVSARPAKLAGDNLPQPAGKTQDARQIKQADQPDMLAQLKAIEAQLAARAQQAADVSALNISYNKQDRLLSVKVQEQQTGELIRELKFRDYKAMAYTSHGYKGTYLDITA